ncbi:MULTISPECIES: CBS domain-containing protein [Clostridium]|jgi:CBS domain-containing protein|uniref:CBS domain-containing protein n=1 Tax=Clostridium TaxID=1485 RepID=UPI000287A3F0|nr:MULTISPECIES: CBS domain-containing protein [Clostridium]MDF2503111.1 putative signal-transduction protein containing cAMP-binding and domain [Clostridium sp.]
MKVSQIMTQSVASLNANDTVERAAQLMVEHNIGSIPVCRGEKVVGVITDRDITLRSVANGENAKVQTVKEIMSSNPVLIQPDMEANDAARIMSERQIRRLPVVENSNLVGIISLGDIATDSTMKNVAEMTLCEISEPCVPII